MTSIDINENDYTNYMAQQVRAEWKIFEWAYTKKNLLFMLENLKETAQKSRYLYQADMLERCLKASGIRINNITSLLNTKEDIEHIRRCIEASQIPEDASEIEEKLFNMLHNMYREFPSSENFMKRLVKDKHRGLADKDFRSDPLRMAILKQFIRHTDYGTAAVKKIVKEQLKKKYPEQNSFDNELIISNIDKSIFDLLQDKKLRHRYPLLKLADDLATGKFRTNSKTREDLYMFAFAFHMTSSFGKTDIDYDIFRDIEKNLFHDFYNDNLMRYISTEYQKNAVSFEAEPSGEGINYKNFAEIIYLYYLNQTHMKTKEKIKKAASLIKECTKAGNEKETLHDDKPKTKFFKDLYYEKQICEMNEEEFKDFIFANFRLPKGQLSAAKVSIDKEQRTAQECMAEIYNNILDEYPELTPEMLVNDYKIALNEILDRFMNDADFVQLISKLDQKLQIKEKIQSIQEDHPVHVTRTDLIAAGFYYYQILQIPSLQEEGMISLQKLYDEFCRLMNPYLLKSRYQVINAKNIFDMYVIAVLYQAVNFS